jgi:predicted nucleotide-binding protein (sugar kinase/HSP70/actin superfamily)
MKKKFAFFQLGKSNIAIRSFARGLNLELVEVPTTNKASVTKGVSSAPEFSCLPFKTILGNMISAVEAGADVVVLTTSSSLTICQASDFAMANKYILSRLGYKFDMIIVNTFRPNAVLSAFKKYRPAATLRQVSELMILFTQKFMLLESLDEYCLNLYISVKKKESEKFRRKWEIKIDATDSIVDLYLLRGKIKDDFQKYPQPDSSKMLKVAVIGDIFSVNDPYLNNKIFERLCDLGVYPVKTIEFSNLITGTSSLNVEDALSRQRAKEYLRHNVGGYSQHTIASAIKYASQGFDGVIQIYPFNCMPETVVRSILPKVSRDYNIPILSLAIDEQTGDAGFATRLEAFVDLINIRKNKNSTNNKKNSLFGGINEALPWN